MGSGATDEEALGAALALLTGAVGSLLGGMPPSGFPGSTLEVEEGSLATAVAVGPAELLALTPTDGLADDATEVVGAAGTELAGAEGVTDGVLLGAPLVAVTEALAVGPVAEPVGSPSGVP